MLIDTVGMSQRDRRITEQIALLAGNGERVKRLLLLSAVAQANVLEDVVKAYRGEGLAGCILTKVDETLTLGGALDVLLRHKLPLHYVTNGQRVPEDLHRPNPLYLVERAFRARRARRRPAEADYPLMYAAGAAPRWRSPADDRLARGHDEVALDQAAGLRRLLARASPARSPLLGGRGAGARAVRANLAVALARRGRGVLVLDCARGRGSAGWLLAAQPAATCWRRRGASVCDAAGRAGRCAACAWCRRAALAALARFRGESATRLAQVFETLQRGSRLLLVDARPARPGTARRQRGEMILLVGPDAHGDDRQATA